MALRDELAADPLARGYSGMSDQAAADDLNTAYRTRNRTSMTVSEVLNAVDSTEFGALSDANETKFWRLMAIGDLNPFGVEATLLTGMFGAGSATILALQAARLEPISRAQELGVRVGPGLVAEARR